MENIGFITVPSKWADITTLGLTLDSSTTYQIECRGQGYALLQVASSLPADNDCSGIRLDPSSFKVAIYKAESGKNLYVKLYRSSLPAQLNIATVEE